MSVRKLQAKPDLPVTPEAQSVAPSSHNGSTFADKQLILLSEYHAHSLAQSRISFWFSLLAASLGFVVILLGLVSLWSDQQRGTMTLTAGTIIEAVSALFFVQSNKARELMATFFDRLRADRKLEEALNLSNKIDDQRMRSKLQLMLSLNFADASTDVKTLSVLTGNENERQNT